MNAIRIFSRFFELPHNRVLQYSQITIFSRYCSTKPKIDEAEYEENIKNKILKASLPFVKEHGWSTAAIEKGAETLGYPSTVHGLFPRKGANLVDYFSADCNQILLAKIKKDLEERKDIAPITFVEDAIKTRLTMTIPYLDKWPQAMALMNLPENVPYSLSHLLTLVDDICYYAGDRSVNFHWYVRRIGLAAVYKTSELYLIQDSSPEFIDTWTFLSKRLEDLMDVHVEQMKVENMLSKSTDVFKSAFITARNILGVNR